MDTAELGQQLDDVHQAILDALASTARPTAEGLRYLQELRAEALALGAEVEKLGLWEGA